jgi:Saxitoxin biosynthesis operon protein SxtJ
MPAFDIPWHPSDRTLRQFSGLWLLATGVLPWHFGAASSTVALVTITLIGASIGIAGWLRPWTIRPLFVGLMVLTAPIGWAMSQVFLAIIFFGVFTPVALVFRLLGRDALNRQFDASAETYWEPKLITANPARYFRPF